jgi:hypothetical protein
VVNHLQLTPLDDYGCGYDYGSVVKVDILGTHLLRKKLLFWVYRLGKGMLYSSDLGVGGYDDCIGI